MNYDSNLPANAQGESETLPWNVRDKPDCPYCYGADEDCPYCYGTGNIQLSLRQRIKLKQDETD